jgi:formamidopyrimidine-DNA glycosylase
MPELPDVAVYVERLTEKVRGRVLQRVRVLNPFLLRTALPPISAAEGQKVLGVERLGKRIVLVLEGDLFLVVHLMIAGRLRWLQPGAKLPGKITLAAFEFEDGTLAMTEAGSKRRASLHLVAGREALKALDAGGLDVFAIDLAAFTQRLKSENHTLKRALTDPRLFSGIGNAYSDEILHVARLSPFKIAAKLTEDEVTRLHEAMGSVLTDAVARSVGQKAATLKAEKRSGLRVHARTGLPCPVCGDTVREVSFADRSFQYCPTCQTEGRELADRRLSKLIK